MGLVDLFVIRLPIPNRDGARELTSPQRSAPAVFTTPQSVTTFSVAICIVATISRASRTILHLESESILVPLVTSFAIGSGILCAIAIDGESRPRGLLDWMSAIVVAAVNSLVLFAAALGIDKF
jgi:hypothetical protein